MSPNVNRSLMRGYLLYFSRIAYIPYYFNFATAGMNLVDPEVHTLLQQSLIGVVSPRAVNVPRFDNSFFQSDSINVFSSLNKSYPEETFVPSNGISGSANGEGANSIMCRIVDSFPMPAHNTPIPDLIAFRKQNQEQLTRLSDYIDEMSGCVSAGVLTFEHAIRKIEDELGRLEESLRAVGLYAGKVDFSFTTAVNETVIPNITELLAELLGVPRVVGGLLSKMISFEPRAGPRVQRSNEFPRCFEYIIEAGRNRLFDMQGEEREADDWLQKEMEDANNTFTFRFPPEGENIFLPGANVRISKSVQIG